jgi:hypothetical protein
MENMKITDLCDDILKSIEFEIKYAKVEKTQKDHKTNIIHFFRWFDSDEARDDFDRERNERDTVYHCWDIVPSDGKFSLDRNGVTVYLHLDLAPKLMRDRAEGDYDDAVANGHWPHYTLDYDKETRDARKIMPDWQGRNLDCWSNFIMHAYWPIVSRWSAVNEVAISMCNTPLSKSARRSIARATAPRSGYGSRWSLDCPFEKSSIPPYISACNMPLSQSARWAAIARILYNR